MDLGTARGVIELAFVRRGVDEARKAFADLGRASETLGGSIDEAGARLAVFGAAATAPFAIATKAAGDFEAQLNGIAAVGGAEAQARIEEISAAALELGATTRFSASEAAAGFEELIKAGLPVQDVLDGAGQAALDLAAATGTAVPQAAEIMANALNVFADSMTGFNTEGEKAVAISNLFAQAANASATDVGELGQAFSQAAIVAAQFGIPVEELVAQFGIFANAGLKGSDAGTSFKTMLQSLLDPTEKQADLMAELGLSFFDAQGEFIGLEGVAGELQSGLAGLTEQQRQTALAVLFGSDAVRAASVLYAEGAGGIADFSGEMANAGTVAEQAATRNQGLNGSLEELRGAAETLAISFGKELIPKITPVIDAFAEFLRVLSELPAPVKAVVGVTGGVVGVLTAGAGAALLFAGQIGQSVTALQTFGTALQTARASSALLAGAIGPLGVAVLAAAAAVGVFAKAWIESNRSLEEATALAKEADDAFNGLDASLSAGSLRGYLIGFDELASAYPPAIRSAFDFGQEVNAYNRALVDSVQATQTAGGSIIDLGALLTRTDLALKNNEGSLADATRAYDAYNEMLAITGPAQEWVRDTGSRLVALYVNGKIGPQEFADEMERTVALAPEWNARASELQKTHDEMTAAVLGTNAAVRELTEAQRIQKDMSADLADQLATDADKVDDYAARWRETTRGISTGIVGNIDDLEDWTKAQEEAGVATRYATELAGEQAKALEEVGQAIDAATDELIAAAKAQSEALAAQAEEDADVAAQAATRAGKERVKALEDSGREEIRAANKTAQQLVNEAERAEAEIVAAAEAAADGAIKAAERAEKEGTRAVERAASLAIREAERTEARTVAAAERQAEAQLAAVEESSRQVVEAAEAQADAQVEAARQAEEETVAAAERAADDAIAAAERQADGQVAALEAAAEATIEAAERAADRQVEAARRAEEQAVAAAERAAERQIAEAERLADRQEAAVERRLERAQEAADRELEIVRDRIDKQVEAEIDAAQQVYDARADEIDWVADREKDAVSYEFEQQYTDRKRAIEDAASAEIAAIRAAGLSREEEAARILEVERRREDELRKLRFESDQAEKERIREIEAARTAALEAAQAERERLEEEARARAEERLAAAEERANRIKEKAQERAAKREAEIAADLERTKQDAADQTAKVAAAAAKARERAEADAAANAARVREQQEALVAARTQQITDALEAFKQRQADETARVAEAAAARREAAETAAAERVAQVQEEQAAIAAAAEERIAAELEDAKRTAARETADVRREQERIVRDEEKALAKETADVVKAENDRLEQARRDAAKATETVRKAADKSVKDAEKINQQEIRAALRETETEIKRIQDWRDLRVEASARLAIAQERKIRDEAKVIFDEAKRDAESDGLLTGEAYADGLIEGLETKTEEVKAAAKELARQAKKAAEIELEIRSPSRWARNVGLLVGDGLRDGLLAAVRDAGVGATALAEAVKGQLTRGIETAPIAAGYAEQAAYGVAARQAQFRSELGMANAAALRMPESLEATVVIDGTDMGRFVVGTALAPIVEAARRTGTRREAWA